MANSAVGSFAGVWTQGSSSSIVLRVTAADGSPANPESISVTIKTANGSTILTANPEKITDGFFVYEWLISASQTVGDYTITWTFDLDGVTQTEIQTLVVSYDSQTTNLWGGRPADIRRSLEQRISCAMNIPIYTEQARPSADNKTYYLTFPRWNQTPRAQIYRNKTQIITSGYEINYFDGKIVFDNALTSYDHIYVDYNFSWFTEEQLYMFIEGAINVLNIMPPASGYNIYNLPTPWITPVVYHAASDALLQLLLCLNFQQPRQVFGGDDQYGTAFNNIETLKKEYEDKAKYFYEQKKFGPYPKTTAVSVPEYTLPGGRSRWFRYLFTSGS